MERITQKCLQGDVELDFKDHALIVHYEVEVVVQYFQCISTFLNLP